MFKYIFITIRIMLRYAPLATLWKFIHVVVTASTLPLSIIATQHLLNMFIGYQSNEVTIVSIGIWAGLLILSMFFLSSADVISSIQTIYMKRILDQKFTQDLIDKYCSIEYACFEQSATQDTLNRMGDSPQDLILNTFEDFMLMLKTLVSTLGTMLIFAQVSWLLVLLFLVTIPIMIWSNYRAMKIMNDMFSNQTQDERKLAYYSKLLSEKESLFELRLFGSISYIIKLWRSKNNLVLKERIKTTIRAEHYLSWSIIAVLLWISILLYVLIQGIKAQSISFGLFVAMIGSTSSLIGVTENLSYYLSNLARHYLQVAFYTNFMNLPEIPKSSGHGDILYDAITVTFHDVYFSYPDNKKCILNGLSFTLKHGQTLAIVGENGAGKSTIIKLITRLYQPSSGYITFNNININDLTPKQLSQAISVIFQDFYCYNLSLRENIALGDPDNLNNDGKIHEVLHQVKAENFASNLDIALGKIEDKGIDLSGGQWQRIAMARALFSPSALLIMDEPTASLDPIAESEIYHSFAQILGQRTAIMISHRLASARMADTIILIADGVVCEEGHHQQLIAKNGRYAQMWQAQSHWYDEEYPDEEV